MKKKYCFRKVRGLCLCTIALTLFALLSACTTLVKPYPFDAAATAVEGRWGFTASDSRYYRGGLVFSEQPDPIRIGETIFDFNGNSYISYVNGNPAFKGSIRFEGDVLCLLPTEKHFNGDNPRWAGLEKDIFDDIKSMERRYSYKVNGDNLVLSIEGLDYTGTKMDSASEVTPDYYKTLPIAADQSYVKVIGTDNFHTIMIDNKTRKPDEVFYVHSGKRTFKVSYTNDQLKNMAETSNKRTQLSNATFGTNQSSISPYYHFDYPATLEPGKGYTLTIKSAGNGKFATEFVQSGIIIDK